MLRDSLSWKGGLKVAAGEVLVEGGNRIPAGGVDWLKRGIWKAGGILAAVRGFRVD